MYIKLLNALNKLFQLGNIALRVDREQCYLGVNRGTSDCVEVLEPVISWSIHRASIVYI